MRISDGAFGYKEAQTQIKVTLNNNMFISPHNKKSWERATKHNKCVLTWIALQHTLLCSGLETYINCGPGAGGGGLQSSRGTHVHIPNRRQWDTYQLLGADVHTPASAKRKESSVMEINKNYFIRDRNVAEGVKGGKDVGKWRGIQGGRREKRKCIFWSMHMNKFVPPG